MQTNKSASVKNKASKQVEEIPFPVKQAIVEEYGHNRNWDWVEASIWTKDMLKALEEGVKGGKWYSIIDKVYRPNVLRKAWAAVKANKGAAGIDKVTVWKYELTLDRNLEELHTALKGNTYEADDIRRAYISKGRGQKRPLGIPTVNDRIAQAAVKMALEPIFENTFLPSSYGFRPGKGAKEALAEVDRLIEEGYTWIVDGDIKSYFDSIPHDRLIEKVERQVSDQRIIDLIRLWLTQRVMEEGKGWTPTEGSPQGAVISPLLANIYLHDLDVKMVQAGCKIIRYADDFVILTKSLREAQRALLLVADWMKENGLTLHQEKTKIVNCIIPGQGFEFLGYHFENGTRWIRKASIMKFRDAVRKKTKRVRSGSMEEIAKELNRTLRGWYNYFKHITRFTLDTFDSFVRRRLRAIQLQRTKRRGFGRGLHAHQQWPNAFFTAIGLFSLGAMQRQEAANQPRSG